jgi:hypothetical protein
VACVLRLVFLAVVAVASLFPATPITQQQFQTAIVPAESQAPYYWKAQPAGRGDAQLLTLFCRTCEAASTLSGGTPLLAVLRDTLGDEVPENDRVTYVWLLTYTRPSLGRRALSAVPFFYWRVGGRASESETDQADKGQPDEGNVKPFLNVATPRPAAITAVGRQILQFTTLDPLTMPVRATSRAYRSNEIDHERLHLEEAVSYLRSAPASDRPGDLTQTQLHTVIARLQLRKKLLGGFVNDHQAAHIGAEGGFQEERIRLRNWELLRQCADKTNLIFEPIALADTTQQYAILWYPDGGSPHPTDAALTPIWKLLNIEDPGQASPDASRAPVFERAIDSDGGLLPAGEVGAKTISLRPLGVYSLNYPTQPLLMIDFRSQGHIRRHEMTQRAINEIVSGVIGISHFTNWYYYAGADLYDFYASRHGRAMNQAARLDCYSQFQVQLTLDRSLEPDLRQQMQRRAASLALNPLEGAPGRELADAANRYTQLTLDAGGDGALVKRLDNDRRREVARFESTSWQRMRDDVLHAMTLGKYTNRAGRQEADLRLLNSYRRVEYNLTFLDTLAAAGTPPEVANDPARIQGAVIELQTFLPDVQSQRIYAHAERTLLRVKQLSKDRALQADCSSAIDSLKIGAATPRVETAAIGGTP